MRYLTYIIYEDDKIKSVGTADTSYADLEQEFQEKYPNLIIEIICNKRLYDVVKFLGEKDAIGFLEDKEAVSLLGEIDDDL